MEDGNHEELMENEDGIYAKMIKAQEIAKGEEDTTLDGWLSKEKSYQGALFWAFKHSGPWLL